MFLRSIKKTGILYGILIFHCAVVFPYNFKLENIPDKFYGTYIPVCFEQNFKKNMSYVSGFNALGDAYPFLILEKNNCHSYTASGEHEYFSIKQEDFEKWDFIDRKDRTFILDENGASYFKLCTLENGEKVFENYILSYLFQDAVHFKNISIEENKFLLDGTAFYIVPGVKHYKGENVSLWLKNENGTYALCLEGLGAKIYNASTEDNIFFNKSDKVYKSIPYFYWHDISYPEVKAYNLTKNEYNFIRNLVYAKHGYEFKENYTRSFFEKLDFYKVNPDFSEDDFSDKEKKLIQHLEKEENKK